MLRAELDAEVTVAVQVLNRRQKLDGGWGWFSQDESNPLVTAYALLGLTEASEAGYAISADVVDGSIRYLTENPVLARVPQLGGRDWQYNREAFVLYALSRADAPQTARMSNLYDNRDRLNSQGKALLAMALHRADSGNPRVPTLMADVRSAATVSASGTFWDDTDRLNWTTDTRATAVILQSLVQIEPDSLLIPNVVRYLVSARTADHWESTQETAWAVIGLTDWMVESRELTPDYDFSVTVNGEQLLADEATPEDVRETRELQVSVAEMLTDELNEIAFERTEGDGNLYYTAFLEAFLPVPDVEAVSNGISVSRRYLDEAGEPIDSAAVGDVIQVRLTVVVPNALHYVVVEDPIPAGTEAIDPNLDTSQQIGTRPGLDRLDVDLYGWGWWWFSNIEFRDEMVAMYSTFLPAGTYEYVYSVRATVPGEYNVIPPTAQEAYFPDVYGRGAGTLFTVTAAE